MDYHPFIPVYKRLTEFYRGKILNQELTTGNKVDSISKVMSRHSVSRETAKLVLKNLVNEGLAISVQGKGTFIASQPEIKKEWAVVMPFYSTNLEQLIIHLSLEAHSRGRKVNYYIHYNKAEEEKRIVAELIREGLEAVIIIPNFDESLTAEFYRRLTKWNTRVILADNTMAGSFFNYVIQSYDLGVKRAYDHFLKMNDRNLLLIKEEAWRGKNLVYDLMEQTLRILAGTGENPRELLVLNQVKDLDYEYIIENKIGGILACTDVDSIRITGRLKHWGIKMPSQVSLVSYGNTELTEYFTPSITSIDCKYKEMAKETANLILNNKHKTKPHQIVIQPKLIIRET